MTFSPKQISLAFLPKVSGTLSFVGSTYIFQDVARSRRRRSKPYNRLILALSTFDIMASVVNIMSTWPIPEGTPGVYAAVGTTATCTAQGFFGETGNMTTPMYNGMLCLYYMLIIRSGWSEMKIKRVEPYLHVLPLVVGLTMGIAGLPLTLYNPSGWLCWYAPYPGNCLSDPTVPCERGELAHVFRWVHYGFIWSAILFVTVGMFLIYRKVHDNEAKTQRFTRFVHPEDEETRPQRRMSFLSRQEEELKAQQAAAGRSRKVANQAMLFVGALYLTWIFTTLTRIFQIVQGKTYYGLLVLMAIFFPLQGFFNAIIYLRPRYLKQKQANPDRSCVGNWYAVIRNKDNLEARDNTEYSVSGSDKRRSFVSKISSIVGSGGRRLSNLNSGVEDHNDNGNGESGELQGMHEHSDDDSFNPEEEVQRLEATAAEAGVPPRRRSSVTFSESAKTFDGSKTQQE
mmetsp:Transcript_26905/g.58834  ORF Transcript_26905/g.58834 Transcript_26905/m.58834 type:complete len:456 (+) Transcript_26905:511-1878(+)